MPWPGIVGKGSDSEPIIPFETLLEKLLPRKWMASGLTVSTWSLFDAHFSVLAPMTILKTGRSGGRIQPQYRFSCSLLYGLRKAGRQCKVQRGARQVKVEQVRRRPASGQKPKLGVRPSGVVRIDSATGVGVGAESQKTQVDRTNLCGLPMPQRNSASAPRC